jgi:hypothetical protein
MASALVFRQRRNSKEASSYASAKAEMTVTKNCGMENIRKIDRKFCEHIWKMEIPVHFYSTSYLENGDSRTFLLNLYLVENSVQNRQLAGSHDCLRNTD